MRGLGRSVLPLLSGVDQDVDFLLKQFCSRESVRFEEFGECFRQAEFSLIFSGRVTEALLKDFSEGLLSLVLTRCIPPLGKKLQERIGAIYLLYSLYYLQAQKYRMKIRATRDQVIELYSYIDSTLQPDGHLDTVYTLHKLWNDDAFSIAAFPDHHNPVYMHNFDSPVFIAKPVLEESRNELAIVNEDLICKQVSLLHERYHNQKCNLNGAATLPASLNICSDAVTEYATTLFREYEGKVAKRFGNRYQTTPGKQALAKEASFKQDNRRRAIKEKAYAGTTMQARHRRHRQAEETDEVLPVEEPNQPEPSAVQPAIQTETEPAEPKTGRARKRATPKVEKTKGVGRPKKIAIEDPTGEAAVKKSKRVKPSAPKKNKESEPAKETKGKRKKKKDDEVVKAEEAPKKKREKKEKVEQPKKHLGRPRMSATAGRPDIELQRSRQTRSAAKSASSNAGDRSEKKERKSQTKSKISNPEDAMVDQADKMLELLLQK